MRCPSCGTENAPDSRFCGGCGARFSTSAARVAPTQKISDDASFPQPTGAAPGHGAQIASSVPRATPASQYASGAAHAPPSLPGNPAPPIGPRRSQPTRPPIDEAEVSMPIVARRPWGLIAAVLVIDLALAAAGTWLLLQGLHERTTTPTRTGALAAPRDAIAAAGDPIHPPATPAPRGAAHPDKVP